MGKFEKLRPPFRYGPPPSVEKRKEQLAKLNKMLTENEEQFCEALFADLHKCRFEALETEILPTKLEISQLINNLDSWAGVKQLPRTFLSALDTCKIHLQPFGTVLIIGAWNYPLFLNLVPLAGAIAAGNATVLKPSELAPATEALLSHLLPTYLDEETFDIFCGGPNETKELLETQAFDFIFYTGSSQIGRLVMMAAAEKLTPVALELGGKCPVYIDSSVDLQMAVKRIISSKFLNAGQTCVSPDYILCHHTILDVFVKECLKMVEIFFGNDCKVSPDFGRIINVRHLERLQKLIKESSGKIVFGGNSDISEKYMDPTIVQIESKDDALMQDEIFGPILPILKVQSVDEACDIVNSRPKPLSIYVFSNDSNVHNLWDNCTSSGSLVFNECLMQLAISNLPFGGVGHSGIGRYRGKFSVELFSNQRAICDKSRSEIAYNKFRYPPYNSDKESWVRWGLRTKEESTCSIS